MRSPDKSLSKITHLSNYYSALNFVCLLLFFGLSILLPFTQSAHAQQQCTSSPVIVGYSDYDYSGGGVTSEPTEEKPESKLWYNDGFWWGVMWEPVNDVYTIHRLDLTNQCWAHVGPNVDDRARSSHDALWDESSQKLYIASRAKLSIQATQSEEGRLYRYSYNSGTQTYSLDSGFPVVINGAAKTRAMVITKDSLGKLWVTWTQNRKVMINRTDGNDANWGTAFILPAQQNDLEILADSTTGDISSIVVFGGNKVGVVWGNQNPNLSQADRKYFFSVHNDTDADLFWQPREDMLPTLLGQGDNNPVADDHISIASPASDPTYNGVVFASLKLGFTGGTNPRVVVAKRDASGNWSHATFGTGSDDHTRPIEVLDAEGDSLFVFAKNIDGDGIFFKSAHFDNLTFSSGLGRPFIKSVTEPDVNNPTSTKQALDSSSGIVVLASDKDSKLYMHNYMIGANSNPVAAQDNATAHKNTPVVIDVTANDTDSDGTIDVNSVEIVVNPINGTATVNASNGEITYTPNTSYVGPDTLKYTVKDNNGVSATASTVAINVNNTPVAVSDSSTTPQATQVAIDVATNDTDSDGTIDPTSVSVTSPPSNGTTSVDGVTGVVNYTPNGGFSGFDLFTYTVNDNDGGSSNAATVTVNVNDPPTAQNDTGNTSEDIPVVISVLSNDSDGDGSVDPTTVAVTSAPTNGSTSVNTSTGEITYTPNLDFSGSDSLTYTVNDDDGLSSNTASVDITVSAVNDNPVAANDSTTTDASTAIVIDILANDTDVDGTVDPTTVTITAAPTNGSASADGVTGEITYTPNGGFSGNDSFTYTVNDNTGALSNTATVTVNVNNPPLAVDDSATTSEDIAVTIDVLANDSDSDGTILAGTVSVTTGPANGSSSIDGITGEITYTPNADFFGVDSLTYTVLDDDSIASNAATVSVTVTDVNDAPVAADDVTTTDEGNTVIVDVLANDSDVDGTFDVATVTVVASPANGTTSVNSSTGEITYTPSGGFSGNDSFTYTVQDDDGATSNPATVTVSTNDRPVAVGDNAVTAEDTPVIINVLSNDSDSDGTIVVSSLTLVSTPAAGTVSVDTTTGQITYTPFTNFSGVDNLAYIISDNDGALSDTANVTITVNDVNDTPIAVNDVTSTVEDTTIVIPVLSNDSDVDGTLDPSTVLIGDAPNNGAASVNSSTGDISYTPNSGFAGIDTLTYTVRDDDAALSNAATVIVTVGGVNFPPNALADNAFTPEDTVLVISVLSNDTDTDGTIDTSSVTLVSAPSNGTAEVISNGQVTLTFNATEDAYVRSNQPTNNFGSELFIQARTSVDSLERNSYLKFNVSGLAGTVVSAKVRLFSIENTASGGSMYLVSNNFEGTVTPWDEDTINFNNAPMAPATPLSTLGSVGVGEIVEFDVTAAIAGNGFISFALKSDISDATRYQSKETVTPPQLVVMFSVPGNTGDVLYTPNPNFVGSDSFTYNVKDNEGAASNTASVSIMVSDENENPVAANDLATTNEDTPVAILVVGNDSDVDGTVDPTTVVVVNAPNNGTTVVDGVTGLINYTPAADFFGNDTFAYTVRDDVGAVSNAATVTVTVTDVNDAPRALNDTTNTGEDQPVVINILSNDSDIDGTIDTTTVTLVNLPDSGSATVNSITGTITYTPNPNFFGIDSLSYTVRDEDGGISPPALVTISVGASNDAPIVADDAASVAEDSSVVIDVLANDTDIDDSIDSTSVTIVVNPSNGSVTVNGTTGAVSYVPDLNFFGTDSFTYTVADNNSAVSGEATVTITVSDQNETPVAVDDAVSVVEDATTPLPVLSNDADVDGTLV
ncbi:tandem-95 repeat protein, partial [bacterium]|nr:tandem-95 repeat protein [bacterium]